MHTVVSSMRKRSKLLCEVLCALLACVCVYVCDKYSSESPCACVPEPQRSSCQYPCCIYLYLLFGSKSLQCRIIVCFTHILRHEKLIFLKKNLLFNHCSQRPNYQNVACCMCIIKALLSNRFGPLLFFIRPSSTGRAVASTDSFLHNTLTLLTYLMTHSGAGLYPSACSISPFARHLTTHGSRDSSRFAHGGFINRNNDYWQ